MKNLIKATAKQVDIEADENASDEEAAEAASEEEDEAEETDSTETRSVDLLTKKNKAKNEKKNI